MIRGQLVIRIGHQRYLIRPHRLNELQETWVIADAIAA